MLRNLLTTLKSWEPYPQRSDVLGAATNWPAGGAMRKLLHTFALICLTLPAHAAIACVQNVTGSTCPGGAATSTLLDVVGATGTFSFANNTVAGSMVIMVFGTEGLSVTSVVGGGVDTFTQVVTDDDGQGDHEYIYVMCSGTGGYKNVVVTLAGSQDLTGGGSEWSGAVGGSGSSCVNNTQTTSFTATSPVTLTGPTNSGNNLMVTGAINGAGTVFTVPSGYVKSYLTPSPNEGNSSAYLITTDSSQHAISWAWAGGNDANTLAASFKPGSVAPRSQFPRVN